MKLESQVIVDQQATVKLYLDLVHTARHMPEVSFVWRYNMLLLKKFFVRVNFFNSIHYWFIIEFITGMKS